MMMWLEGKNTHNLEFANGRSMKTMSISLFVVCIDNGYLSSIINNPPKLLDAINKHGLAIFLIASHHKLVPMFA